MDFEKALLARLRENAGVIAVAGTYGNDPALDFDERKSNDKGAFPAAIQSLVSPGKQYDQDGADVTQTPLMRWECFGLTGDGAYALAKAIEAALDPEGTHDGVRFGRGFTRFERPFPPERVGELTIYRRIVDMDITATIQTEGN